MTGKPCRTVQPTAQQTRVLAALQAMPRQARDVFMLHRFDGWPYSRIAAHMGLTSRQVEKAMCKAMVALHEALDGA